MISDRAASHSPMVEAKNIRKRFEKLEALKGVSVSVNKGDATFIIGPSGCGKSTFLRCLNLLEEPDGGELRIGQRSISFGPGQKRLSFRDQASFRTNVGMVFQQFHLFPHMTVLENVMEGPLTVLGMPQEQVRDSALALLEKVGLTDKRDVYPRHLSGGQSQRVAIARALAMKPDVMLFDEPTSALDPELVKEVLQVIRDLRADGITMLVVTHEMSFARDIASSVVFMDGGVVVEEGPPSELFTRPKSPRLATFLSNFS